VRKDTRAQPGEPYSGAQRRCNPSFATVLKVTKGSGLAGFIAPFAVALRVDRSMPHQTTARLQNLSLRRCGGSYRGGGPASSESGCSPAPTPDTLTTYATQIAELRQQEADQRQELLERVPTAWFNRLAALPFISMPGAGHPFRRPRC